MGFEDEVEQSLGRPYRRANDRSKRTYELTSSIVPRKRRAFSLHRSGNLPNSDWLADDAVGFEPDSKLKFPNNREKYRENRKIGPRNDDEIIDKASIHAGF